MAEKAIDVPPILAAAEARLKTATGWCLCPECENDRQTVSLCQIITEQAERIAFLQKRIDTLTKGAR